MHSASVDLGFHGDQEEGTRLNFAVNVRGLTPPAGLRAALEEELTTLGAYPSAARKEAIAAELARRNGVSVERIVLLSGAAEGFTIIAHLGWRDALVLHPGFTEPGQALRQAGVPVTRVVMEPPFSALPARTADLERPAHFGVVGCPINPTGTVVSPSLSAEFLLVDEAFADVADIGVNNVARPNTFVTRSLTKTWNLAGLRCGYMIIPEGFKDKVEAFRPHWALGSLQLAAFEWVLESGDTEAIKREIAAERAEMVELLATAGFTIATKSVAPYLLVKPPGDAEPLRRHLAEQGIAVRRCDTFPGLDLSYWRLAVRPADDVRELIREVKACQR